MAVSFGMLGILLMLDVCFIVNYFFVRALRGWANRLKEREAAQQLQDELEAEKKHSSDIISNNFQAFVDQISDAVGMNKEIAFAWVVGEVKLESLKVKKFPGWRPIPLNLGILSTCFIVTFATTLLSPDLVTEQLGISLAALDGDFCSTEVYDTGVTRLRNELVEMTNLEVAKTQYNLMSEFHSALVNDTVLYGVAPYECPAIGEVTGRKEDWDELGPFFPGYCEAALEAAIDAAQSRECVSQVCDCPEIPDNAAFEFTGLAGKKFCGEVCIDVPYACPGHTADNEAELEEIQDYRFEQFQFAEKRRQNITSGFPLDALRNAASPAIKTAEKLMFQVDVASYLYIGYQCLALFFPSPLILFRLPVWTGIKRLLFGVQKPYFICFVVAVWWGLEYFRAIWYNPEIRLLMTNLRGGDPCFVDLDYLYERQMVLNDVCGELTPMLPSFRTSAMTVTDVLREVDYFSGSCDCSFPNQHLSQVAQAFMSNATDLGFNVTMNLCDGQGGAQCDLYAPYEDISFMANSTICTNSTAARKLVYEATDSEFDWWEVWIASGFLATLVVKFAAANFGLSLMALADPFVVCAGEFLWVPSDMGMEIRTDGGGTERVQFLEAFDERGRALPTDLIAKWFNSKKRALYHVGLSRTFFWGFIVHWCMFNMFVAVREELGEDPDILQILQERDTTVLACCLSFAVFVAVIGIKIICKINRLPKEPDIEETADDSCDEDEDETAKKAGKPGSMVVHTGEVIASPLGAGDSELLHGTVIQVDTFDDSAETKYIVPMPPPQKTA